MAFPLHPPRRRRLDVAERHYRIALRLDPTYFNAQFNLGRVLLSQGRKVEARAELRRAAGMRPRLQAVQDLLRQAGG